MGSLLSWLKSFFEKEEKIKASDKFIDTKEEKMIIDEYSGKKNILEKIRIYLYGKELKPIKNLFDGKTQIKKVKNVEYSFIESTLSSIECIFFDDEITKERNTAITYLLQEDYLNKDFCDIIIVSVNSLDDFNTKLFFDHFQSSTRQKIKQPFFLFLTLKEENPNIKYLYNQITNKYFDKRNLTAMKFPEENDFSIISNYISEKISYYNGYGDLYDKNDLTAEYLFNVLVCGISGVGKSTFINMFLHSKRSKEGEGNSVTDKIIRFTHPKFPIGIYDTPGFENEATVIKIRELLKNYNEVLRDERKKINLILYFLPYTDRLILDMEKTILEYLCGLDCEIIFVINKVGDDINGENFLRYKETFEDHIENNYSKYREMIHYVPINLYPSYKNGILEKKAFGSDDLFNKIYKIFSKYKIQMNMIENISTIQELQTFLNENKLYNQFKNKNDLVITLKSKTAKFILKYSKTIIYNINKEKDIKRMIQEIYNLYYDEGEEEFYEIIIGKKLSMMEIDQLYDNFFNNLSFLKNLDKSNNFSFFKSLHDKDTIAIGNYCSKQLEEKFSNDPNLFIKNNKPNLKLFRNLCFTMNKAIDSFKIESDEFRRIYQLLEKREKGLNINNNDLNNKEIHLNEIKEETTLKIEDNEINLENKDNEWWNLFF